MSAALAYDMRFRNMRANTMNKIAVFAGLLFWSWVWGIWGMLPAVPMMMVVKVVITSSPCTPWLI